MSLIRDGMGSEIRSADNQQERPVPSKSASLVAGHPIQQLEEVLPFSVGKKDELITSLDIRSVSNPS